MVARRFRLASRLTPEPSPRHQTGMHPRNANAFGSAWTTATSNCFIRSVCPNFFCLCVEANISLPSSRGSDWNVPSVSFTSPTPSVGATIFTPGSPRSLMRSSTLTKRARWNRWNERLNGTKANCRRRFRPDYKERATSLRRLKPNHVLFAMPTRNKNLHGNVPDKSPVALLLIDVINDLDFAGNESLLKHARTMANRIVSLKRRAASAGIASIYVNDNFGKWQSDFRTQVQHCLR